MTHTQETRSLRPLRALGLHGWDALEPAIVAALASESPILLIGPHGSGKTLLLARVAEALGLVFRHYNASILSFDDLLGFPVPQDGRLVYLQTPATIWDAEAVLFDEVSRCRPELQNKLFPLVHERVAQGVPLPRLRHRWAAMNPPPGEDGADGAITYEGAQPLDVALADRFAFVLTAPGFDDLTDAEQASILRQGDTPEPGAGPALRAAVEGCRAGLAEAERRLRPSAAEYACVLAGKLKAAGHPLSTRRAVALARNIESLHAAHRVLYPSSDLEESFYGAARFSLPDAAWGRPPESHVVIAAHHAAWEATRLAPGSPERVLLAETDPWRRMALALGPAIPPAEAGAVLADAIAQLPRPARLVTSSVLFPRLASRTDLPASTLEIVAADFAAVARTGKDVVTVRRGGRDWKRAWLGRDLTGLDTTRQRDRILHNVAAILMTEDEPCELEALAQAWDRATNALGAA